MGNVQNYSVQCVQCVEWHIVQIENKRCCSKRARLLWLAHMRINYSVTDLCIYKSDQKSEKGSFFHTVMLVFTHDKVDVWLESMISVSCVRFAVLISD